MPSDDGAEAHPSWNLVFVERVAARTCVCMGVRLFWGIVFDLADVKTRKSAFKRGFSANVAKRTKRSTFNEWGIHTCAHNNICTAKMSNERGAITCERDGNRGRTKQSQRASERNYMFPWFLSQNVLLFRFQFLYGSDVFRLFSVLCLHNLVFENMKFMRFCLILRIDPFTFFLANTKMPSKFRAIFLSFW